MLLGVLGQPQQAVLLEVVSHEVSLHVHDELAGQRLGAGDRHAGLGGLGRGHVEHRAEHLVHGQERRRHAGRAGQERAPAQAVTAAELIGHLLDARLHARLLAGLRQGVVLAVRHDLRRHRRAKGGGLGGGGSIELGGTQVVRHH